MKNKYIWILGLAITVALSGCGKGQLEADNAELKTQLGNLQHQLDDSSRQLGQQQATITYLQSRLSEAQKEADKSDNDLKNANVKIELLINNISTLTNAISDYQKAKDKDEADLKIYRDTATSAIGDLKALRATLDEKAIEFDNYSQNYINTKMDIIKLVDPLPQSEVKGKIVDILQMFTHIKDTWENANVETDERTEKAKEDYNEYLENDGYGATPYAQIAGSLNILKDAATANLTTQLNRNLKIGDDEHEIDAQLLSLDTLVKN